MRRSNAIAALAAGLTATSLRAARAAADEVRIGVLKTPAAPLGPADFAAFTAQGIVASPVEYATNKEVLAAISAAQIDVALIAPDAAMFDAIGTGINATIVADAVVAARTMPGGDTAFIVARKDLAPYGRFDAHDARGLTIAVSGNGQLSGLFATQYLATVRLSNGDIGELEIPLPDMAAAMQNHAIDLASSVEPFATALVQSGIGVKAAGMSAVMPGCVQGVMLYGTHSRMADRALGLRFMRAFATANTTTVRPKLAVDVDGRFGLRWQLQQYVKLELVTAFALDHAVDNRFAQAVDRVK